MSHRRRSTLAPTLFPFLAVLVCTLGTLILFLALVAQKADKAIQQAAQGSDIEKGQQSDARIADEQWLQVELAKEREKQTAVLERRRSELAYVEDRVRALTEKLSRLQTDHSTQVESPENLQQQKQAIAAMEEQANAERELLKQLKAETTQRPRVVIAAHKGPNGTDRRPIYIECTKDGVIIQSEGVKIPYTQLQERSGISHPLVTALRAIRLYWQRQNPNSPPPYPLLVVRPNGIESYGMARQTMKSWDDHFGYELVSDEVHLAFPIADQELKRTIELAINDATMQERVKTAGFRNARLPGRYGILSASEPRRFGSKRSTFFDRFDQSSRYQSGRNAQDAPQSKHSDTLPDTPGSATSLIQRAEEGQTELDQYPFSQPEGQVTKSSTKKNIADSKPAKDLDGANGSDPSKREQTQGTAMPLNTLASVDGKYPKESDHQPHSRPASGTQGKSMQNSVNLPQKQRSKTAAPSHSHRSAEKINRNESRWALPRNIARSQGAVIERTLELVCDRYRCILKPARKGEKPQEFSFLENDSYAAPQALALEIRRRIDSWGIALAGGRWEPILIVDVRRGAESRFWQLKNFFRGSGLVIEKR